MGEARGEPARDITHARADCRERIGADRDGLAGWLGLSSGRLAAWRTRCTAWLTASGATLRTKPAYSSPMGCAN